MSRHEYYEDWRKDNILLKNFLEDEEIVGNSSNGAGAVHMSDGTDGYCSDISNDDDAYTSDTDDDNNDEELNALLEKKRRG